PSGRAVCPLSGLPLPPRRVGRTLTHRYGSEWERANPGADYDPELFRRDILPRLVSVKLSEIVEATGMSKAFASQVRAGKFTPHVSTWQAFGELVGLDPASIVTATA
ncbi:MAG: hypothetical protein ACYDBS_07320, partial [Acidimicrobiales bacterium]